MANSVIDRVLSVTEQIHPLMGPIFTGRPASVSVGEQCTMCLDNSASETAIIDGKGRTRYVCLAHELMLHRAYAPDQSGLIGADHYQAYVMEHIMRDAAKPHWMPTWA